MQASLRRAKASLADGTPCLFKGSHFGKSTQRGGYPSDPKWHVLEELDTEKDGPNWFHWVWVAKCGYQLRVDALSAHPESRLEVKTAKLRCKKCEAAVAKQNDKTTNTKTEGDNL